MHPAIQTRHDQKRGCGWRKPGGLYLLADGDGRGCGKLPIVLDRCPSCGAGIKQTRGWTWIDSDVLAATEHCATGPKTCEGCPLAQSMGKVGLLWIGKAFYNKPSDFLKESARLGISRRISAVPRDFEVGKTWIWLAHPEVVKNPEPPPQCDPPEPDGCDLCGGPLDDEDDGSMHEECKNYRPMLPGVFRAFVPQRIEYVVTGNETDEEIDNLVKRGITPVKIERQGDTTEMF